MEAIDLFVHHTNNFVPETLAQPAWIRSAPGKMTKTTITADFVEDIARFGGGHVGRIIVAPNNTSNFQM